MPRPRGLPHCPFNAVLWDLLLGLIFYVLSKKLEIRIPPWHKSSTWGSFVNGPLIYSLCLTQSTSFQLFFLLSLSFVVTVGNINFLSHRHTRSPFLFLFLQKPGITSFTSTSTLGPLTGFFLFVWLFVKLCRRMLGKLAAENLVSQVAVGGQICWQSDRLTSLGPFSSAHSFPPRCIPTRAGGHWPAEATPQKKSVWY